MNETEIIKWIDVHAHLNYLEDTPAEVLSRAEAKGVDHVITIGTCKKDHETVLKLVDECGPKVFGTLGVHPHEAEEYTDETDSFLRTNCDHPKIVAIGEIGLDYYYDNAPREIQKNVFKRQLQIAIDKDLPVQIHTRDAEQDTVDILKSFDGKVRGIIHCFTGSQFLADECLKLGLNISISGVVTFKKATELQETVKTLPLDRIHVETDSPFLAPVPNRGKKNEPSFVVHTAEKVSELKGIDLKTLSEHTRRNTFKLFNKITNKAGE